MPAINPTIVITQAARFSPSVVSNVSGTAFIAVTSNILPKIVPRPIIVAIKPSVPPFRFQWKWQFAAKACLCLSRQIYTLWLGPQKACILKRTVSNTINSTATNNTSINIVLVSMFLILPIFRCVFYAFLMQPDITLTIGTFLVEVIHDVFRNHATACGPKNMAGIFHLLFQGNCVLSTLCHHQKQITTQGR